MELWIRSQNRALLIKSPELRYNQKGDAHSILAYDTLGAYRILGTYKTRERALEILDEIQKLLKTAELNNDINTIFYQMPEK